MSKTIELNEVMRLDKQGISARLYPVFKAGKVAAVLVAGYVAIHGAQIGYSYCVEQIEQIKRQTILSLIKDDLTRQIEIGIVKGELVVKNGDELNTEQLRQALAYWRNRADAERSKFAEIASVVGHLSLDNFEKSESED